jgi:hypothetical protein
MSRRSDGQWRLAFAHTYEANYSYPSTAQRGNYTVLVSVIDNNGYNRHLDTGTHAPFIESATHSFTIGVITYHDPAFQIVDHTGDPLPNAQVYITWPNGSRDVLPRYTSTTGFINLTHVPSATYGFTIVWKDVVVQQATIDVDSDGPYIITTAVYALTVKVTGNDNVPIQAAYVIIYSQTGVAYGLSISDETGQAIFKLPKGTYAIEAHYSAGYWLNVVTTSATATGVLVNTSTSTSRVFTEFPPPIWSTTGFWLLTVPVAVLLFATIYLVFIRRRHH